MTLEPRSLRYPLCLEYERGDHDSVSCPSCSCFLREGLLEALQQMSADDAQLILSKGEGVEGGYYARLGDYDNGRDELSQKVRVDENGSGEELLSYRIKIETNEHHHPQQQKKHQQQQAAEPSDYLKVRLTDGEGEQLEVLKKYTDWDAGGEGWRRQRVDLSGYEGRTVYVSFEVKTDELHTTAFYLDGVALGNSREHS